MHIPEPLTPTQGARMEELRKRGFHRLSDNEVREFHRLADQQIAYLRFHRGGWTDRRQAV